jgi:hypothetical protein
MEIFPEETRVPATGEGVDPGHSVGTDGPAISVERLSLMGRAVFGMH